MFNIIKFLLIVLFVTPEVCFSQASLELWPVTLTASAEKPNPVLWIKNVGKTSTSIQVRVVQWEQVDKNNVYSEQDSVYPTPIFLVIPAGTQSPVRFFGMNRKGNKELQYRVVIDELPQPGGDTDNHVKVRMQYILPFFLYQNGLDDSLLPGSDGLPRENHHVRWLLKDGKLEIKNNSKTHLKITSFALCTGNSTCTEQQIPVSYVLPGREIVFIIKNKEINGSKRLIVKSGNRKEVFVHTD